jgi:hypothetical protein
MGWFNKKTDFISDRAQALNDQIAALEDQIRELDAQLATAPSPSAPRLRSTARPHGASTVVHPAGAPAANGRASDEPIFEEVDQNRLKTKTDSEPVLENHDELGLRKSDLSTLLRRAKDQFRGPTTTNPKLVSYLAAGSIQGLRPMRYEKRIARNRFLTITAIVLVLLAGIFAWIHNHR